MSTAPRTLELLTKLGHELPDIRARALKSLAFKLRERLVTVHDIVQELPALDSFLNMFFPFSTDDKPVPLPQYDLNDAVYVLELLARHPFGYHWLHQRRTLARLDALKQVIVSDLSGAAAVDTAVAALLSLPDAPEPPRLPNWAPSTAEGFASYSSAIEEKISGSLTAVRRAGISAADLLVELDAARTHDEFLSSLWHLHELCSSDHAAAATIVVEGRWEVPLRRFIERKPTSAADDIVLVQVLRFLGLLCTLMPVAEGLLLLYAVRDHMLPLLPPGECRPRVQCAIIDLLTCLVRGERANVVPDSSADSDAQALAAETVRVCDDAGVLSLAVDIACAAPSLASLQAFGQVVDDVRPHALGLIDALLSVDVGVALLDRSSPLLEKVTRCLVDVVSSFRSPDSAARAASLRHALTTLARLAHLSTPSAEVWWLHDRSLAWLTCFCDNDDASLRTHAFEALAGLARFAWARIRLSFDTSYADVLPCAIGCVQDDKQPMSLRIACLDMVTGFVLGTQHDADAEAASPASAETDTEPSPRRHSVPAAEVVRSHLIESAIAMLDKPALLLSVSTGMLACCRFLRVMLLANDAAVWTVLRRHDSWSVLLHTLDTMSMRTAWASSQPPVLPASKPVRSPVTLPTVPESLPSHTAPAPSWNTFVAPLAAAQYHVVCIASLALSASSTLSAVSAIDGDGTGFLAAAADAVAMLFQHIASMVHPATCAAFGLDCAEGIVSLQPGSSHALTVVGVAKLVSALTSARSVLLADLDCARLLPTTLSALLGHNQPMDVRLAACSLVSVLYAQPAWAAAMHIDSTVDGHAPERPAVAATLARSLFSLLREWYEQFAALPLSTIGAAAADVNFLTLQLVCVALRAAVSALHVVRCECNSLQVFAWAFQEASSRIVTIASAYSGASTHLPAAAAVSVAVSVALLKICAALLLSDEGQPALQLESSTAVGLKTLFVSATVLVQAFPSLLHAVLALCINCSRSVAFATLMTTEGGSRGPTAALLPFMLTFTRRCLDVGTEASFADFAPASLLCLASMCRSAVCLKELCKVCVVRVFACVLVLACLCGAVTASMLRASFGLTLFVEQSSTTQDVVGIMLSQLQESKRLSRKQLQAYHAGISLLTALALEEDARVFLVKSCRVLMLCCTVLGRCAALGQLTANWRMLWSAAVALLRNCASSQACAAHFLADEQLVASIVTVATSSTVLPARDQSDADAVKDVLATRLAAFDALHSLVVHRQKAKALLADPTLQELLLAAYAQLQDDAHASNDAGHGSMMFVLPPLNAFTT